MQITDTCHSSRNEKINPGIASPSTSSFVFTKNKGKIEKILTYWAFSNQLDQIDTIEKFNPSLANFKRKLLYTHINSLTSKEKLSLGFKLTLAKMNIIRTITMRVLHIASWDKTFPKLHQNHFKNIHYPDFDYSYRFPKKKPEEWSDWGELVHFYTDDHQQLNGLIIYGDASKTKDRPVVIISPSRNAIYEDWYEIAFQIARKNQINVLLYDCRGTGSSLGKEYSTDHGAEDCKAAIKYALKELCQNDEKKIGVIGYSWGGGISALALKKFVNETGKKIGLYCNLRSYSSLSRFIKFPTLARVALWILGINELNAGKILSKEQLSHKTIVMRAKDDGLMEGEFCLYRYLQKRSIANVEYFEEKSKEVYPGASGPLIPDLKHGSPWDLDYIGEKIQQSLFNS